nr:hypothetical protein [Tanacetum cinerariifolium]
MAAGSRDRPPMLATGRCPQWRSRFLRYIDTRPNGDALRKCILSGPYKPTTVLVQDVAAIDDSTAISEHTTVETPMNMSSENQAHFQAEKEAIHLILTGIRDEIYSTVDACQTAKEMWEAIERLQQDTNEEIDKQELEAHYSYMVKIKENDQNDVESDDERVALANLKLDVNKNKKHSKAIKESKHNTCSGIKRVQNYSSGN